MPYRLFAEHLRLSVAAVALLSGMAAFPSERAIAQTATELPPLPVDAETSTEYRTQSTTTLDGEALATRRAFVSDTAAVLGTIPGVDSATGGGVSGLPIVRGLGDDRNRVLIDGMPLTSACPNHMNPATSYIDPTRIGSIDVVAGITPVSQGGDSIGSTIAVKSVSPVFAAPNEGVHTEGSLSSFYRSNARTLSGAVSGTVATEDVSLGYTGSGVRARNYQDGNGNRVGVSQYAALNHAATLAARGDGTLFTLQGGQQFIPYEGYPNQRMDLLWNRSTFLNSSLNKEFSWGTLETRLYWQTVDHFMNFLPEKSATGNMPMYTAGRDLGYSVKGEIPLTATDLLRVGHELHSTTLNDWWPAVGGMMGPNTFINIKDGSRDVFGTYAEWQRSWSPQWTTLFGLRNDTVLMNAGAVQGYNTSATYAADAAAFNARDHHTTDINIDVTGLVRFEPASDSTYEAGLSRKTRSPNLYERYAWSTGDMASSMVTWFGDGNGYLGDVNLKPETAYTASVSGDWHDEARDDWGIKATPYITYVRDYIDVDKVKDYTGNPSRAGFSQYRFANHDALLYGVDLGGRKRLAVSESYGRFDLTGALGWVQGERLNTGDSLYHLMPINAKIGLDQKIGRWSNGIDARLVGRSTDVSTLRHQPVTPEYAVFDLRSSYDIEVIRFDVGITNLFDTQYYAPLGGVDYIGFRQNGSRLPYGPLAAPGRSFNAGVTVRF